MTLFVTQDDISPALAVLRAQARNPRGIMAAASRAVANLFKKHLRLLDRSRPNKLGGKRTHMWNQFASSVNVPVLTDTGAMISISDPRAAHKHTGGVITAKRSKFLTIPVSPEAHGRTARTVESELGIKLFVLGTGDRAGLFGQMSGGEQGVKMYFVLKRSVDQPPDPPEGILPPDAQIRDAALTAGQAALQRQLRRN
jgi:hypothetical protein